MVRNNKMLTSRHEKAPESFDSEALDHDYYIWVKKSNCKRPDWSLTAGTCDNNSLSIQIREVFSSESFESVQGVFE